MRPLPRLVLVRGLPGSGKSTIARTLAQIGYDHVEADMFFERDGTYVYDSARIKDAHAWCQQRTNDLLACGNPVVVANTFTQHWEMHLYKRMSWAHAAEYPTVIVARGDYGSIHNVPREAIERMKARWEY